MNIRKIDVNEFRKRKLERQLKNLLLAENIENCKEKIELFKQQYLHNQLVLKVFEKQEQDILNLEYICSFERGLSYSKKGWVRLMNILYETYPKKMEEYF